MVSLQKFLIGAVSFWPIDQGPLQTFNCIPVRMATKLYKLSLDQACLNSFKHLIKQSIHINTFNAFSKVDRNNTLS